MEKNERVEKKRNSGMKKKKDWNRRKNDVDLVREEREKGKEEWEGKKWVDIVRNWERREKRDWERRGEIELKIYNIILNIFKTTTFS